MDVRKIGAHIQVSPELLEDSVPHITDMIQHWMTATPEERAARAVESQRLAAQQKIERAAMRDANPVVELTLEALLDKLGWSTEYATHTVQPYCTCEEGLEGWERCDHAVDLELLP